MPLERSSESSVGFGCGFSTAGQSSAHTARTAAEGRRKKEGDDRVRRATGEEMEGEGDDDGG
jgi:predicted small metal-binding protein